VLGSVAVALGNSPSSVITSGIGLIVAMLIAPKLRHVLDKR